MAMLWAIAIWGVLTLVGGLIFMLFFEKQPKAEWMEVTWDGERFVLNRHDLRALPPGVLTVQLDGQLYTIHKDFLVRGKKPTFVGSISYDSTPMWTPNSNASYGPNAGVHRNPYYDPSEE